MLISKFHPLRHKFPSFLLFNSLLKPDTFLAQGSRSIMMKPTPLTLFILTKITFYFLASSDYCRSCMAVPIL